MTEPSVVRYFRGVLFCGAPGFAGLPMSCPACGSGLAGAAGFAASGFAGALGLVTPGFVGIPRVCPECSRMVISFIRRCQCGASLCDVSEQREDARLHHKPSWRLRVDRSI